MTTATMSTKTAENRASLLHLNPQLANVPCGKAKQSRLGPIAMAGFKVTAEAIESTHVIVVFNRSPVQNSAGNCLGSEPERANRDPEVPFSPVRMDPWRLLCPSRLMALYGTLEA